jgi:FeoB-associated Cys-rich membrane protein
MAWGSLWDMGAITVIGAGAAFVVIRHLWRMWRPSDGASCGGGCSCGTKRNGGRPDCG